MHKEPFFIRHNKLTIATTIIVTLLFGINLFKLKIDAGLDSVIPSDDPDYIFSKKVEQQFGSNEKLIILIRYEDGIYTKKGIQILKDISKKSKEILSKHIKKINIDGILQTASYVLGSDLDDIEKIKHAVEDSPSSRGMFVSKDYKTTLILSSIPMDFSNDASKIDDVYDKFLAYKDFVEKENPGLTIDITGKPIIKKLITNYIFQDMMILFPSALVLFFVLLLFLYKDFFFAFISIGVTLLSICFTFSIKAMMGSNISLVDPAIPIILIAISSASSIHILIEIRHMTLTMSIKKACRQAFLTLLQPIILASITTSLGFASLGTSNLPAIKLLGLFLASGIIYSMFITLFFVPALGTFYKPKSRTIHDNQIKYSGKIVHKILKLTPVILTLTVGLIGFSIFGVLNIQSDTDEVSYFKKDTAVRKQAEYIQKNLFGITNLYVSFKIKDGEELSDSELEEDVIKVIYLFDKIDKVLKNNPHINFTLSYANIIKSSNYQLRGKNKDEKFYRLPKKKIQIKAYLRLMKKVLKTNDSLKNLVSSMVSEDNRWLLMSVYLKSSNLKDLRQIIQIIKDESKDNDLKYFKLNFAGEYSKLSGSDIIIKDQITSLTLSIVGILIILTIINFSLLKGLLITIPVFLAIFVNFGIMWVTGVKLNPATAIIASIGLGSGVDYGIHYYLRLFNAYKKGYNKKRCIVVAFNESFKGIMINALSVACGFLIMIFSKYEIITNLGIIIAFTMIISSLASLVLLPILFYIMPIRKNSKMLFIGIKDKIKKKDT